MTRYVDSSRVMTVARVGLARGISALDLRVIRTIFMSWIITLPAGVNADRDVLL